HRGAQGEEPAGMRMGRRHRVHAELRQIEFDHEINPSGSGSFGVFADPTVLRHALTVYHWVRHDERKPREVVSPDASPARGKFMNATAAAEPRIPGKQRTDYFLRVR